MDHDDDAQRTREVYHGLTVLPGAWTIIRVDGRAFSRLTEQRFTKPYDERFADLMVTTAETLLTDLGGRYAYTQSDEISVLLDPRHRLFGRGVEKLVSVAAGLASSTFTHAGGAPAHFDARLWVGAGPDDVAGYFRWRQADAARNALSTWCYWTLRNAGRDRHSATRELTGRSAAGKIELLREHGIDFATVPGWQRRGIGLWWGDVRHAGFDPVRQVDVEAVRRRVVVERDLPGGDAHRALIDRLTGAPVPDVIGHAEPPAAGDGDPAAGLRDAATGFGDPAAGDGGS